MMRPLKKYIILITLLLSFFSSKAQYDTEFWFAMPVMSANSPEVTQNIHCSTFDRPANISVVFLFGDTPAIFSFRLEAYQHCQVNVPSIFNDYQVMRTQQRGVHVTSDVPIACCYDKRSPSGERYTLKGHTALGTDFLVPGQTHYPNATNGHSTVEIIATENNTNIQIVAPVRLIGGVAPNTPYNIILQRGECFAIMAANNDDLRGLAGTRIHASHPIAVNTSNPAVFPIPSDSLSIDDIGEQIVPISMMGTRYAAITSFCHEDRIFIFPTKDSTTITINGNDIGQLLNTGDTYEQLLDSTIALHYIVADKPIAVFQTKLDSLRTSNNSSRHRPLQLGGTILPHLDCTGSRQASVINYNTLIDGQLYYSDSIHIYYYAICKPSDTAFFTARVNGNLTLFNHPVYSPFRPLPGDSSLVWMAFNFQWYDNFTVTNATGNFHFFAAEQTLNFNSFTCHTSYDSVSPAYLHFDKKNHTYCNSDSIRLRIYSHGVTDMEIYGPDSLHITNLTGTAILPADSSTEGIYYLHGLDTLGCRGIITDTINIHVTNMFEDEYYDTIVENQLPWQRFGATFPYDTDTLILRQGDQYTCDSLFNYHLHVFYNQHDSLYYYLCNSQLPFTIDTFTFYGNDIRTHRYHGIHGEDSTLSYVVNIIPTTDTTIYDTIVDTQLPYFFFDTLFSDSVANHDFFTFNEAGCDSVIHYNLYVFWNGDHCDTTLEYPNYVTPNGDGINDRFVIKGLIDNNCFKYNELSIYDRWGHRVFYRQNIDSDDDWWDPDKHRIPAGTYFFYFKAHGVNIHTQHSGVIEVFHDK